MKEITEFKFIPLDFSFDSKLNESNNQLMNLLKKYEKGLIRPLIVSSMEIYFKIRNFKISCI